MKRIIVLLLLLLSAFPVRAEYYCMFFAADSWKRVHVWGTFVRGAGGEEVTISWAPSGGWDWLDRRGRGYDMSLEDSMRCAGGRVCVWGPYEIEEGLYLRAKAARGSSGDYKMLDWGSGGRNCIHRLCELTGKRRVTHVLYGRCAAESVKRHYEVQGLLKPTDRKKEILSGLGLDGYELRLR